jgi:hypothetical protein
MPDESYKIITKRKGSLMASLAAVALILTLWLIRDGFEYRMASVQLYQARHSLFDDHQVEAAASEIESQRQDIQLRMIGEGFALVLVLNCIWNTMRLTERELRPLQKMPDTAK